MNDWLKPEQFLLLLKSSLFVNFQAGLLTNNECYEVAIIFMSENVFQTRITAYSSDHNTVDNFILWSINWEVIT